MNVIDLFSGAGGMTLGAIRAGFNVIAGVEIDEYANQTHKANFNNVKLFENNIMDLSGDKIVNGLGIGKRQISGVVGGPPCQGFSSIGKKNPLDVRNFLFRKFMEIVDELEPDFFVAENVPGILTPKYNDILEESLSIVLNKYYVLKPFLVKAYDCGVPTTRSRVFFVGFRDKKLHLNEDEFSFFKNNENLNVRKALVGLPTRINPNWITESLGIRKAMRIGYGEFFDKIYDCIPNGVGDVDYLDAYRKKRLINGCMGTRHSVDVEERYGALGPGEKDMISKSIRLDPDGLCPTLRAGTWKDHGRFQAVRPIHYSQPRVITPREAARLQGFPDWFMLHATKWHSFRQIGNSVSPIVAERVLDKVKNIIF